MRRKKFIAGNWKMYTSAKSSRELAAAVASGVKDDRVTVAVCPPNVWLTGVADALKGSNVLLGAQNVYPAKEGAFTGDVGPEMLLEAGCAYAIVGHSERRHGIGETDAFLNLKVKSTVATGLKAIFCVGELLAERESNQTNAVLERQISAGLAGLTPTELERVVIAYEPVWAIGTGKVASPEQAQEAHSFIRDRIAKAFGENSAQGILILYGGSVKPDNAAVLLRQPDIDGALVGGAALKADSFLAIVAAA